MPCIRICYAGQDRGTNRRTHLRNKAPIFRSVRRGGLTIVILTACLAARFRRGSAPRQLFYLVLSLILADSLSDRARAKEVEEKYPGGQVRATYNVKDGRREGPLTELYESGKVKVRAFYKADQLTGSYATFHENGKPHITATYRFGRLQGKLTEQDKLGSMVREANYRDGVLNGPEVLSEDELPYWQVNWIEGLAATINGVPVYTRSQDDLWYTLGAIARGETPTRSSSARPSTAKASAADPVADNERVLALRRLNAYRYLAELPADVGLDAEQNAGAESAAKLIAAGGKLQREPANPGWPDAQYDAARKALEHCSVFTGHGRMADVMDLFLHGPNEATSGGFDDRRWCLNPAVRSIGLGRSGNVVAMWSHEDRRKAGAEIQTALYPSRGFMPVEFFSADSPWLVLINPKRVTLTGDNFDVTIRSLDDQAHPGPPLKITDRHVAAAPAGLPTALVFKPAGVQVAAGKRYWVEVWGLKASGGAAYPLQYLVDFITVHPEDSAVLAVDGVPAYPRTIDDLRRGLESIYNTIPAPFAPVAYTGKKGSPAASTASNPAQSDPTANPDAVAAVQRLNAYRFLCGVPANVTLDPEQTFYAQAGSKLLKAIDKLDHTPPNPGLPDQEYKDGYNGTSHSNLFEAGATTPLSSSIDGYMNDSDEGNIKLIGHRRWCLNPFMQTTGFGKTDKFAAMWSMDSRRPNSPDWEMIAFPARGYMPTEYFHADYAWCVLMNAKHFKVPDTDGVDVSIRPLDDALRPGDPLEMEYKNVDSAGYGSGTAIIFRPKSLDAASGRRYGVELKGLSTAAGKPVTIRYVVEFADLGGKPGAKK